MRDEWEKTKIWLTQISNSEWTSYRILVAGFALLIIVGTLLLALPIASATEKPLPLLDALFTATSAVSVTGLTVIHTGNQFSVFGELVILFLIQIGGLGIMTGTTLIALLLGKRIQYKERLVIQRSFNLASTAGIVRLVIHVIKITVVIEVVGALLLTILFYREYGGVQALYMGIWHSVSAFCNAGLDIFGMKSSYKNYIGQYDLYVVVGSLMLLGGIGFPAIDDILKKRRWHNLNAQTKLILTVTVCLNLLGTVILFLMERDNPYTLGKLTVIDQVLVSFFQSLSSKTSGIDFLNIVELKPASLFFITLFMFIGSAPGSTGGGIRTSTFGIAVAAIWALVVGKQDVTVFYRRVSLSVIYRAFAVIFVSMSLVIFLTGIMTIIEPFSFLEIFFEVVSAFSTIGLSMGITSNLSPEGKILLIVAMFIGRIGTLTLILSLTLRRHKGNYQYLKGKFRIG